MNRQGNIIKSARRGGGAPASSPTRWGFNVSTSLFEKFGGTRFAPTTSVSETPAQCVTRYKTTFGLDRLPIGKVFPNTVPTTWNTTSWDPIDGDRVIVCMRPNVSMADMAAGGDDAEFTAFCQDIPSPKHVYVVLWNEPESALQAGTFTAANFNTAHSRFKTIANAQSTATKKIEIWTCFQTPFQVTDATYADYMSWLPAASSVHGYGWDCYLNPFGVTGPTGGLSYSASFGPDMDTRFDDCISLNNDKGVSRWGVMEYGGPARDWDTGTGLVDDGAPGSGIGPWTSNTLLGARDQALTFGLDYLEGQSPAPEFILFFDSYGTNWDQRILAGSRPTNGNGSSSASPWPAFSTWNLPSYPANEPFAITYGNRIKNSGDKYLAFDGTN